MKRIKGLYNSATIYADVLEDCTVKQIQDMCDFEAFKGLKIRIMPDVHAGAGCTIGTTMTIKDKIVPNMVGVDIGCGMEVTALKEKDIDLEALDKIIYAQIPSGMNSRQTVHCYADMLDLTDLKCFEHINANLARHSIGTLGGGNHFIELDTDEDGTKYLVIHSGSRHLGLEVAKYYQELAYNTLCGNSKAQIQAVIEELKAQGKSGKIQSTVEEMRTKKCDIPKDMAYLTGSGFDDYIHDMKIIQRFAEINRKAMTDEILKGMNLTATDCFTTIHNYIDTDKMILRKGAVSAEKGERLLIPINMRDGSLICSGKGNESWNCSAPHGAGRLMSRGKAFNTLTMEEFEREMTGIYSTSVNASTLDESPMAYKSLDDIVGNIGPTVKIVKRILPVYNFKSSEDFKWRK